MDWDVLLDGNSIRDKVVSFSIRRARTNFCNELTLVLADYALYSQFDFTEVPESERIEILTDIGQGLVSQGKFFAERPNVVQDKDQITLPSLWGRDKTARLTQPFARRINKEWDEDTTLFGIIEEMLEACGLEYSAARVLISDYKIYGGSYSVRNRYPVEILADLVSKTDGYLRTDRSGKLWVLCDLYHWDTPDGEVHGGLIQNISEQVEYPDFGNRIKVGTFTRGWEVNVDIQLSLEDSSIAIGGSTLGRAIVTHNDGRPVADGYAVQWTSDNPGYAHWQHATTHVKTVRFNNEGQRASGRRRVSTDYPIRQVHSVTETATGQQKAVESFQGRSIILAEPLQFTDSTVTIDYEAGGIAENTLIAGSTGEVEVDVHAVVEVFVRDTVTARIDSESGQEQGDKDMYVTVIYKDFHTREPIPEAAFSLDGESKGNTDPDGIIDLGLVKGGLHDVRLTKTGYQDTEGDGLANDEIYVGESAG